MAVLIACEGGLQDMAAVAKHKELFKFITDATVSRPSRQVELFMLYVDPPIGLARVAASWCPARLPVHVALVCPTLTR